MKIEYLKYKNIMNRDIYDKITEIIDIIDKNIINNNIKNDIILSQNRINTYFITFLCDNINDYYSHIPNNEKNIIKNNLIAFHKYIESKGSSFYIEMHIMFILYSQDLQKKYNLSEQIISGLSIISYNSITPKNQVGGVPIINKRMFINL